MWIPLDNQDKTFKKLNDIDKTFFKIPTCNLERGKFYLSKKSYPKKLSANKWGKIFYPEE